MRTSDQLISTLTRRWSSPTAIASGDLSLFVGDEMMEMVRQLSAEKGYLDGRYMAAMTMDFPVRDAEALKEAYDGAVGVGDDNGYAVYLAVECTDARWPTNWNRWRRDNWRLHFKYPFLTWDNAWYNAPCATWPVPPLHPTDVSNVG